MSLASFAQVTLSQSVDPLTIDTGGVACWSSPASGGTGEYRDNTFARTYDLSEFGIVDGFSLTSVEFGQAAADEGKVVTIIISTVDTEDLSTAVFTEVGTQDVTLSAANDMTLVTAVFDTPVLVSSSSIVAVQVFAPDSGTNTGETFFPGYNLSGENGTPWLRSDGTGTAGAQAGCSIPWSDANSVVADQNYVINIVGEDVLGVNDLALSQVSIYPNPATDVLNINVPSSIELAGVTVYDVLGKKVNTEVSNDQVNVSGLSRGVYVVNVITNAGTLTEKLIIE